MAELLVGAVTVAGFWLVVGFSRRRKLPIAWWQWFLTVLGFIYGVFVLEVIIAFLKEDRPKGALVIGFILGFFALVWAVLLGRFVFARAVKRSTCGEKPLPANEKIG